MNWLVTGRGRVAAFGTIHFKLLTPTVDPTIKPMRKLFLNSDQSRDLANQWLRDEAKASRFWMVDDTIVQRVEGATKVSGDEPDGPWETKAADEAALIKSTKNQEMIAAWTSARFTPNQNYIRAGHTPDEHNMLTHATRFMHRRFICTDGEINGGLLRDKIDDCEAIIYRVRPTGATAATPAGFYLLYNDTNEPTNTKWGPFGNYDDAWTEAANLLIVRAMRAHGPANLEPMNHWDELALGKLDLNNPFTLVTQISQSVAAASIAQKGTDNGNL
jgi:hypothetical protein